ncbi:MAG: hypothetical protein N3E51_02915 [Candidatus Micrarchaeota archaeon]|nr:hypothetical protein [Candidatus Micrarchaeota archaeon]
MRVLVFGNPLAKSDSAALKVARMLEGKIPKAQFVRFDTSEDLEKEGKRLIIMDAVAGLQEPRLVRLEELELPHRPISLHGFDLLWSLLLLKKLGRLEEVLIIGVPAKKSAKKSLLKVRRLLEKII